MALAETDHELLAAFRDGEADAFEALYHRHVSAVLTYVCAMLRDRDAAEDVVQQVFIGLARNAATLREGTNVRAYLFTSARNSVLNVRRQAASAPKIVAETFPAGAVAAPPGEKLESEELRQRLNRALETLPEAEREVVLLHTRGELGFREIAELTGTPQGTVATRYRTALAKMREHLSHD